ncbi:hypothetical protein, partial [Escherichia coli]|uniref:hypothetical protein n=1 Tax=Escherichia coli TaxID=562 RepID=UPI0010CC3BB9
PPPPPPRGAQRLYRSVGVIRRTSTQSHEFTLGGAVARIQVVEIPGLTERWVDMPGRQWKVLPGAEHFSWTLSGSVENGWLTASMKQAKMPYETVFRAPLE